AHARNLHVDAALVDAADGAFDGNAGRVRLFQLGPRVVAAAQQHAHHDAAFRVDHRAFDGVADFDVQLALAIAQLGEIDHAFRFCADVHEHRIVADGHHATTHRFTDAWIAPRPLVLGEQLRKIFVVWRNHYRSASLLPTTVRFKPTCTCSGLPSTLMVVLPLKYQPNEPVENSRFSAVTSWPPMLTFTDSAFSRNADLLMGQGDL